MSLPLIRLDWKEKERKPIYWYDGIRMAHMRTSTEKFRVVSLIFGKVSVQCLVFNECVR